MQDQLPVLDAVDTALESKQRSSVAYRADPDSASTAGDDSFGPGLFGVVGLWDGGV